MTTSYVEFDDEEAAELIPIMISVTAPSNLEAGCEFEAYENGDKNCAFTCVVPPGGVQKGQTFMVPLPELEKKLKYGLLGLGLLRGNFAHDSHVSHPLVWLAFSFFNTLVLGQVMQRMSLTWRGVPGDRNSTRNTFRTVVMISLSYCVFEFVLMSMVPPGTRYEDFPPNIMIPLRLGNTFFSCWNLYLAVKIFTASYRASYCQSKH